MTYDVCMKLITIRKKMLTANDWNRFVTEMKHKLDVFLLADRLTNAQYEELTNLLNCSESLIFYRRPSRPPA